MQGPEITNKGRVNAHCLASHENARLVPGRRRKGKDQRTICLVRARVSDSCFSYLICLPKKSFSSNRFFVYQC